jgi:recombination protein RecT
VSRTNELAEKLASAAPPAPATNGKETVVRAPDRAVALLDSMQAEFERCLPSILPLDLFMRIALTGFRTTPDLLTCSRQSLMGALMDCARLGLAPCSEQASLVPFKGKVTLIVRYEGYVQLMYRSGEVEQVNAELVLDGEEWEYSLGDGGRFFHRPDLLAEKPGRPLFAYAYATLVGGGRTRIAIVRRPEALALQRTYSRGKPDSAWNTNFDAMWLKTALRRLQKFAPKSPEMRRALVVDGASYDTAGVAELPTIDSDVVDNPTEPAPAPAEPAPAGPAVPADPDDPWADLEVARPPDARP